MNPVIVYKKKKAQRRNGPSGGVFPKRGERAPAPESIWGEGGGGREGEKRKPSGQNLNASSSEKKKGGKGIGALTSAQGGKKAVAEKGEGGKKGGATRQPSMILERKGKKGREGIPNYLPQRLQG